MPLNPFENTKFEHERSRIFADYWLSLPKVKLIPRKTDFDPIDQRQILTSFVIHELVSPDEIIVRLAGTAVRQEYGFEPTGTNYLDRVAPQRRAKASEAIHLVCEHPVGMRVKRTSTTKLGHVLLNESLALPMRDDEGMARLVYYQTNMSALPKHRVANQDELLRIEILDRTFLDIGAGIPNFQD